MKRFISILFVGIFVNVSLFGGQSLLTKECDMEAIPQLFIEGHSWVNFPKFDDRDYWNAVPEEVKQLIIADGQKAAATPPEVLTGYDYLLFKQGDSYDKVSQKILSKKNRLETLILAELLEGEGHFIDEISNSVWDLCALGNWTGPEAQYLQTGKLGLPAYDKIVVDELAGEIAGILSWAYYFFENEFNEIDPNLTNWIVSSVRNRFLKPNLDKYDLFWMCYRTNSVTYQTPWISYNWLLANLLIEKDNQKRQQSIYKALECLDQFYKQMPSDGACSSGAEIWQYSVGKYFQSLELLELVSVGEIDIYNDEVLKKMGEFICYTHISDNYYFNYSECSPGLILPASLIFRYGKKVGSNIMMEYGSYLARKGLETQKPLNGDLFNKLNYITGFDELTDSEGSEPLPANSYFPESQIITARSEAGTNEGFFFGFKGGHNDELANQNDAGNFVLYANGKPFIVDPGKVGKTVKSINYNERYNIWANQSAWHNLPTINGYMESKGANHRVVGIEQSASDRDVKVSMNLLYAYDLKAGINKWERTFDFDRKRGLTITDDFELEEIKGETFVSFITVSEPQIKKPGELTFTIDNEKYSFDYKASDFEVFVEEVETSSDVYLKNWGSNLYRIVLKPKSHQRSGRWNYSFTKG
ncbi:MAG: heparinase II/III-family protein [Prolixibacteraceae bacterium]|nr:heparinase II/III-family protein [Prolixibacteraceae bacterium]